MLKLSAFIITLNEESCIERCLNSLLPVADEIVVVDSLSTDQTKNICLKYNVKFIEQKFLGYVEQKRFALAQTTGDLVLSIDADEALDEVLQKEILNIKSHSSHEGYELVRLTNYNGFWVRHSGWYPDVKMRLAHKKTAYFHGTNPHDVFAVDGSIARLRGDLLHYSYDSISAHILQTDKFSSIEAQTHFARGKKSSIIKLISRPIWQFIKDYFLKRGFLDGKYGFIICSINALYVLLRYAKMQDLENNKKI